MRNGKDNKRQQKTIKNVHFSDFQNSNFRYQLLYLGYEYNKKTKQHFPISQLNSSQNKITKNFQNQCLMNGLFNQPLMHENMLIISYFVYIHFAKTYGSFIHYVMRINHSKNLLLLFCLFHEIITSINTSFDSIRQIWKNRQLGNYATRNQEPKMPKKISLFILKYNPF